MARENFFDLLREIRQWPGVFILRPSITHLAVLLVGYQVARWDLGIAPTEQELKFNEFYEWVKRKYNITGGTRGWWHIILDECEGDEEEAFNTFCTLFFEEFLGEAK